MDVFFYQNVDFHVDHIDNAKCSWNLHKVINKKQGVKNREILLDIVKLHEFPPFLAQSLRFLFYVNFNNTLHCHRDPSVSFLFMIISIS